MSKPVVIVVDDDEETLQLLKHDLERKYRDRYRVLAANSGREALEKIRRLNLKSEPVALLLVDQRMPEMSGVEFLSLSNVHDSEVPVIVVSGVATEVEARACLKLGALDFIRKPVTLERLGQVLAYLRPFALARRPSGDERVIERRPAPRAAVKLPVRIDGGREVRDGTCTELSSTGMRVRVSRRMRAGQAVKLGFTPSDGGAPMNVVALVVRADPDSAAFWFLDLLEHEVTRLNTFVSRLLR